MLGHFLLGRRPRQLVSQLGLALQDLGPQLLCRPADADLPALIAEVALDLTGDARPRIRGEGGAERHVKAIDGAQQAHVPNLKQIFPGLRAVPVPRGAALHQPLIPAHQFLAGGLTLPVPRRK